jgi:hypothetical protein
VLVYLVGFPVLFCEVLVYLIRFPALLNKMPVYLIGFPTRSFGLTGLFAGVP